MTSNQVKGKASLVDALGDIRTQIGALVLAIQVVGAVLADQIASPELKALHGEVQVLRAAVEAQRLRADSLVKAVVIIDRLAKVKCRETKDFGVRALLECE